MNALRQGLILFAHGSRDPQWSAPLQAVAQRVAELDAQTLVRCAYLELMQPDLSTCVAELVAQQVPSITVLPMFLGLGRHARLDLPDLVQAQRARHPQVSIVLRPAIGEDARVVDLLARIALAPS